MPITALEIAQMLVNPNCSNEFIIKKIDGKWQPNERGETLGDCLNKLSGIYHQTYGDEVGQASEKSVKLLAGDVSSNMTQID
jgi:hypothetical protein